MQVHVMTLEEKLKELSIVQLYNEQQAAIVQ